MLDAEERTGPFTDSGRKLNGKVGEGRLREVISSPSQRGNLHTEGKSGCIWIIDVAQT